MAEQQDQTEVDGSLRLTTTEASQGLILESELPMDSSVVGDTDARGSEGGELMSRKADRSEGFDKTDGYHTRRVVLNGKLLLCYTLVQCTCQRLSVVVCVLLRTTRGFSLLSTCVFNLE